MSTAKTRREAAAMIRRLLDYSGLDADSAPARRLLRRLEGAATALEESAERWRKSESSKVHRE